MKKCMLQFNCNKECFSRRHFLFKISILLMVKCAVLDKFLLIEYNKLTRISFWIYKPILPPNIRPFLKMRIYEIIWDMRIGPIFRIVRYTMKPLYNWHPIRGRPFLSDRQTLSIVQAKLWSLPEDFSFIFWTLLRQTPLRQILSDVEICNFHHYWSWKLLHCTLRNCWKWYYSQVAERVAAERAESCGNGNSCGFQIRLEQLVICDILL